MSKAKVVLPFLALLMQAVTIPAQRASLTPPHGVLTLNPDQLPAGVRIVAVEIHFPGAFTAVSGISAGWDIDLRNGAQEAVLNAKALSTQDGILETTFKHWNLQVTSMKADEQPNTWGWFDVVTAAGSTRKIPFSSYSFKFSADYPRHRLY